MRLESHRSLHCHHPDYRICQIWFGPPHTSGVDPTPACLPCRPPSRRCPADGTLTDQSALCRCRARQSLCCGNEWRAVWPRPSNLGRRQRVGVLNSAVTQQHCKYVPTFQKSEKEFQSFGPVAYQQTGRGRCGGSEWDGPGSRRDGRRFSYFSTSSGS